MLKLVLILGRRRDDHHVEVEAKEVKTTKNHQKTIEDELDNHDMIHPLVIRKTYGGETEDELGQDVTGEHRRLDQVNGIEPLRSEEEAKNTIHKQCDRHQ